MVFHRIRTQCLLRRGPPSDTERGSVGSWRESYELTRVGGSGQDRLGHEPPWVPAGPAISGAIA